MPCDFKEFLSIVKGCSVSVTFARVSAKFDTAITSLIIIRPIRELVTLDYFGASFDSGLNRFRLKLISFAEVWSWPIRIATVVVKNVSAVFFGLIHHIKDTGVTDY